MITYKLDAPRCQHIHPNGMRCGSPALRGQPFCYNHDQIYNPRALPGQKPYKFPALETQAAMEIVVRQVLQAYHDNQITTEQTRTYFYGLQLLMPHVCKGNSPYAPAVQTELTPAMQQLAQTETGLLWGRAPSPGQAERSSAISTATDPDSNAANACNTQATAIPSRNPASDFPTLTTETPTSDHQIPRKLPVSSGDLSAFSRLIDRAPHDVVSTPEINKRIRQLLKTAGTKS